MISQTQKVSSSSPGSQPSSGAWYARALSLFGVQLFFFILIAWIMWSTRDANDLSGLAAIIPLYGLYLMALPAAIVSIIALVRERVGGWPIKKVAIVLSIILNVIVLALWLWTNYGAYFIDDDVRIEPISFVAPLILL